MLICRFVVIVIIKYFLFFRFIYVLFVWILSRKKRTEKQSKKKRFVFFFNSIEFYGWKHCFELNKLILFCYWLTLQPFWTHLHFSAHFIWLFLIFFLLSFALVSFFFFFCLLCYYPFIHSSILCVWCIYILLLHVYPQKNFTRSLQPTAKIKKYSKKKKW